MSLYKSLFFARLDGRSGGRLGAVGCALALSFCGVAPEEEVPQGPAAQPAALGGPVIHEGQGPFLGTTTGTGYIATDPTRALPKQAATGCDGHLTGPMLVCDRGVSRWVPRLAPVR
jgi:hypothetical protein